MRTTGLWWTEGALVVVACAAIGAGACSASPTDPQTPGGPGSATPDGSAGPGATGSATAGVTGSTAAPVSARPFSTAVIATVQQGKIQGEMREGVSCEGIGTHIAPGEVLKVEGTYVVQKFSSNCGCPTGPHYTLLYHPGTAPLQVRLCAGPGKDPCEALCFGTLPWELTAQMKEARAATIEIIGP